MAEPLADKDNAPALAFHERLGFEYSAMRVLRKKGSHDGKRHFQQHGDEKLVT